MWIAGTIVIGGFLVLAFIAERVSGAWGAAAGMAYMGAMLWAFRYERELQQDVEAARDELYASKD